MFVVVVVSPRAKFRRLLELLSYARQGLFGVNRLGKWSNIIAM